MENKKEDLRKQILSLVYTICNSTAYLDMYADEEDIEPDVPTDSSYTAAYKILKLLNIEKGENGAKIFEIPLCWSNQVVIRYTMGEWLGKKHKWWSDQIFDVSAGIDNSDKDNPRFFLTLQWEPVDSSQQDCEYASTPFRDDMATLLDYNCPLSEFLSKEEIKQFGIKRKPDEIPMVVPVNGNCPYAPPAD